MAKTITVTIVTAKIDIKGVATITVELNDGIGKWIKIYTYNQTDPIDFAKFKERITADLKKDLKIKDQLVNITSQINKSFTITI